MPSITIAEADVAARHGAILVGLSYTFYGFTVLQTQFQSAIASALKESKKIMGDPVDASVLDDANEIALNIACRDTVRMCLTGPLLTDGISFSLTGLNINKGFMPGTVEQLAGVFDKKVQDLLHKFQDIGGVSSTEPSVYYEDTLGYYEIDEG